MQDRTALIAEITAIAPSLHFGDLRVGGRLGCGDYGCVFTTSQAGVVVKIGSQWSEYAFARLIIEQNLRHPMLPEIFEALPLNEKLTVPSYAVIREAIGDLSFPLEWLDERLADLEYDMADRIDRGPFSADNVYNLAVEILEAAPGNQHDELVFEEIVELVAWCLERGIILGDMLAINFGRTIDGQIKLRDLGGTRILKAKTKNKI